MYVGCQKVSCILLHGNRVYILTPYMLYSLLPQRICYSSRFPRIKFEDLDLIARFFLRLLSDFASSPYSAPVPTHTHTHAHTHTHTHAHTHTHTNTHTRTHRDTYIHMHTPNHVCVCVCVCECVRVCVCVSYMGAYCIQRHWLWLRD